MSDFAIIAKLGGRDAALAILQRQLPRVTADAMRMWRQRRSMPGRVQVVLMRAAEELSVAYTAADFAIGKAAAPEDAPPDTRATAAA